MPASHARSWQIKRRKRACKNQILHHTYRLIQTFIPIKSPNVINKPSDLIVRNSHFIIEHSIKDKFSDHYILDDHVLGEGAFGRV